MDQTEKDAVSEAAARHGLRVLLWEPMTFLQLVAQEGNGPTIPLRPGESVETQIAAGLPRLKEWLAANPSPGERANRLAAEYSKTHVPPQSHEKPDAEVLIPVGQASHQVMAARPPCGGCQANAFKKAVSAFKVGVGLARFVGEMAVGIKASQEVHDSRKATCEGCPLLDSAGDRMFRGHDEGHSCGKPRLENVLRDEEKDGCGCWLEMKWWGKSEKCPAGKWQ